MIIPRWRVRRLGSIAGVLLLLSGVSGNGYGNDTYFYLAGGTLHPSVDRSVPVEMRSESIHLTLYEDFYDVTVDFEFFNRSDRSHRLLVGFPIMTAGTHGQGEISRFQAWTNGVQVDAERTPVARRWGLENNISSAWTRSVEFGESTVTTTSVVYRSTYGRAAPSDFVAVYLFGTGSVWADSIGHMELRVTNYSDRWLYDVRWGREGAFLEPVEWVDETTFRIVLDDHEPHFTDTFRFHFGPALFDRIIAEEHRRR